MKQDSVMIYLLLYMSGLNMMSAISNKEHLARLPSKPGSQLKKDGRSHLLRSVKYFDSTAAGG